jgi:hypothetical protein
MRGPQPGRISAVMALSVMCTGSFGAVAQDTKESPATFNERFPVDQTSTQPSLETQDAKKEQNATTATRTHHVKRAPTATRIVGKKRAPSRVVVVPRSFLNAGTEVLPGQRKFLDYAFPPTHVALGVVTNTGGRVGWHNSPLPGPFFPQAN